MMERPYTPPVFHIERASKAQRKTMQIVFDILEQSGIDFCIVDNGPMKKQLRLIPKGNIDKSELIDICSEIVEMYQDGELYTSLNLVAKV